MKKSIIWLVAMFAVIISGLFSTVNAGYFGLSSEMDIDTRIEMHQSMREARLAQDLQQVKLNKVVSALELMTAKQDAKDAKIAKETDFLRMFNEAQAAQATQVLLKTQMTQMALFLREAENARIAKKAQEVADAQKAVMIQLIHEVIAKTTG